MAKSEKRVQSEDTADPTAESLKFGVYLRSHRREAGLTLDGLAAQSGLDKSYLSRLERGQKVPSVATVMKLSAALNLPVGRFFGEMAPESPVRINRAAERQQLPMNTDTGISFEMLTRQGRALEAFIVHPGSDFGSDAPFDHDGEELLLVLSGTIELSFTNSAVTLETQDCAQFPGRLPHRLRQVGSTPACAVVVVGRSPGKGTIEAALHGRSQDDDAGDKVSQRSRDLDRLSE